MIPKTLAMNGGYDAQDVIVKLVEMRNKTQSPVGLDLSSGEPFIPTVRACVQQCGSRGFSTPYSQAKIVFNLSLSIDLRTLDKIIIRLEPSPLGQIKCRPEHSEVKA